MLCQYNSYDDFPLTALINCDSVYLRWDVFWYMHASCVLYCVCAAVNIANLLELRVMTIRRYELQDFPLPMTSYFSAQR